MDADVNKSERICFFLVCSENNTGLQSISAAHVTWRQQQQQQQHLTHKIHEKRHTQKNAEQIHFVWELKSYDNCMIGCLFIHNIRLFVCSMSCGPHPCIRQACIVGGFCVHSHCSHRHAVCSIHAECTRDHWQ